MVAAPTSRTDGLWGYWTILRGSGPFPGMNSSIPRFLATSPALATRLRALQAGDTLGTPEAQEDLKVLSYVYIQLLSLFTEHSQACSEGGSDGSVQDLIHEEEGGRPRRKAPGGGSTALASSEGAGHPGVASPGLDVTRRLDLPGEAAGEVR